MKHILLLLSISLFLAACSPAPQVTAAPDGWNESQEAPQLQPMQLTLVDFGATATAPPSENSGSVDGGLINFDVSFENGEPNLDGLESHFADLGFQVDETSMDSIGNAAKRIVEVVPSATIEVVCEGGDCTVYGRDSFGLILMPDGERYLPLLNSKDAKVHMLEGSPFIVKHEFVTEGQGGEVLSFMQFYDGETWVWNETALAVFARNQGVDLGMAKQDLAQQGMLVDSSGDLWQYDVTKKEMKQLTLPDGEYAKLAMQDDKLVAVSEKGNVLYEYNMATGEWGEVVPESYVFAHNDALRRALENIEIPEDYVELTYDDGSRVPLGYLGNFGGSHVFSVVGLKVIHMSNYDAYYNDQARGLAFGFVFDGTEVRMNFMTTPQAPWLIQGPIDKNNLFDTKGRLSGLTNYDQIRAYYEGKIEGKQMLLLVNSVGERAPIIAELLKFFRGESIDPGVNDGLRKVQIGLIWMPED